MMMPFTKSLTVIKQYEVENAPTGENTRYITEDGAIWKPCFHLPNEQATGERFGVLTINKDK